MSEHNNQREEVFSKSVRAGKRTYFFDVKSTKANDYYLTITESKKRLGNDGTPFYEKHKIFLYREDFEKFLDGMNEAFDKVHSMKGNEPVSYNHDHTNYNESDDSAAPDQNTTSYSDVNFDDLGK
ncbi:MAG: DUF3276 family protein [Bacteroidota bacterium]